MLKTRLGKPKKKLKTLHKKARTMLRTRLARPKSKLKMLTKNLAKESRKIKVLLAKFMTLPNQE